MKIQELLSPEAVRIDLKVSNKKQAFRVLAKIACSITGVEERLICDTLIQRERLATTGVGEGVAIPHAKIDGLDKLCAVFARLKTPINYDSVDDEHVDLIFLLVGPLSSEHVHLKALAKIARLLRSATMCAKLRGSTSADAIYALLVASLEEDTNS